MMEILNQVSETLKPYNQYKLDHNFNALKKKDMNYNLTESIFYQSNNSYSNNKAALNESIKTSNISEIINTKLSSKLYNDHIKNLNTLKKNFSPTMNSIKYDKCRNGVSNGTIKNMDYSKIKNKKETTDKNRRTPPKNQNISLKKIKKRDGHLHILKSILTPELAISSVNSLYLDRIRPLFIDVLQRVKCKLKSKFIWATHDGLNNKSMNNTYYELYPSDIQDISSNSLIESIGHYDQNELLAAIESLDVFILFIFINSQCRNSLIINIKDSLLNNSSPLPKTTLMTDFLGSYPLPTASPSLIHYINQLDIHSKTAPECLPWVDPHDPRNMYNELEWRSFGGFLTSRLAATSSKSNQDTIVPYQFKGGRYGLALELKKSEFPALQELSLGELCHLVQLAITGRLLAYEHSVLQPVASCIDISGTLLHLGHSLEPFETDKLNENNNSLIQLTENNDSIYINNIEQEYHYSPISTYGINNIIISPEPSLPHKNTYLSPEELAHDLSILLETKPEGLVTAQLKKALLSNFGKELIPQKFGYKKLTEFLTHNTIISSVCQVVCLNPPSDCLLLIHRKHIFSPKSKDTLNAPYEMMSSPGTASTASSVNSGSPKHYESLSTKKKPIFEIPQVTLAPAPALLRITYNAWAIQNQSIPTKNIYNILLENATYPKKEFNDDDDIDIFEPIQNIILSNHQELYSNYNIQLSTVYEHYWDCFIPKSNDISLKSHIRVK